MSLVQISDLELYLQATITGTSNESKYEFLIGAVQDLSDSICFRELEENTYTELQDGNGSNSIFLNQTPITNISSVNYGSAFGGNVRDSIDTEDFLQDNDVGELIFGFCSAEQPQLFEVVYTAGYTGNDPSVADGSIPQDLLLILMEEIQNQFKLQISDPTIKSEKIGDYSYTLTGNSEIENISQSPFAKKLRPWIRSSV